MTEPFSREDALALFDRVAQAEAVRVAFTAIAYAMNDLEEEARPTRFSVIEKADRHLPRVLEAYAAMPGRTVQLLDVEEKARALLQTLRSVVAWLNS